MFSSFWCGNRLEIGTTSILSQQKDANIYTEEMSKLLKDQGQKMDKLKRQQDEEKVKLEEEFSAEFAQLMEKHNHYYIDEELQTFGEAT